MEKVLQKPGSDDALAGKVAIVTGASRGIGRAIAEGFCATGARVVLTGRNAEIGEQTAREISKDGCAHFVRADQSSDSDWATVLKQTLSLFGRLDILVANAGLSYAVPTAEMTLTQFRDLNTVNLKGCFLALKHSVEAMRRHKDGGAIVLMSSIVGKVGVPGFIHYAAAKDGVRLMAKAAALELGPEKIRVNSIHPGMIRTDMTAGFDEKMLGPMIPMGGFGEPRDIANAALFLASDRGKFITGTELVVDGGWIAR